jgi:hypothetical protein
VRNDWVFNNITVDGVSVVELIQRLSWHWFLNNTAKGPCLLYEWIWNRVIVCCYEPVGERWVLSFARLVLGIVVVILAVWLFFPLFCVSLVV